MKRFDQKKPLRNTRSAKPRRLQWLAAASCAGLLAIHPPTARADDYWNAGANGNWNNASDWSAGVPTSSSGIAFITSVNPSDTVALNVNTATLAAMEIGSAGSGVDTLNQTANFNITAGYEAIGLVSGAATYGIHNQSAGTNTYTAFLDVGDDGGTCTYNLQGSGTINLTGTAGGSTLYFIVGDAGNGTFNQSGGTINSSVPVYLGYQTAGVGTYNLNGSSAALNVNSNAYIGGNASSGSGTGVLNITSGGTATITGQLVLYNTSGTAVNLNGGTLSVGSINSSSGVATNLNWSTGTLSITGTNGLIVGGGHALGPTLTLSAGKSLAVTNTLAVGYGTVNVGSGGQVNADDLYVGGDLDNDIASFSQTGGQVNLSGSLVIDELVYLIPGHLPSPAAPSSTPNGAYYLSNGGLSAASCSINPPVGATSGGVAPPGVGELVITGGTASFSGELEIFNGNGTATVSLGGQGVLSAGSIDTDGNPASFQWSSGTLDITGSAGLTIGSSGPLGNALTLGTGMTLNVINTLSLTDGASFRLNAGGTLLAYSDLFSTGYNTFVQTGGTNTANFFYLGNNPSAAGLYIQNGGTNFQLDGMAIGNYPGGAGEYDLSGTGVLKVTGDVYLGAASNPVGVGALYISSGGSATVSGSVIAANTSGTVITLQGGTLAAASINTSGNLALFQWTSGTLDITGSGSSFGGTLTVPNGGLLKLDGSITDPVAVTAGGVFDADANTGTGILVRSLNTITLGASAASTANALMSVLPAAVHTNRQLIVTAGLTIAGTANAWQGLVDLANNDMDVQNGSLANIASQIKQGFNGGNWLGTAGITSTTAAVDTAHLTALGVIVNGTTYGSGTTLGKFDGTYPAATDVLVKYTYYGDANLDGQVDGSDYTKIDNAFNVNKIVPGLLTGWGNGDFNYDGVVDGSDYTLIDNAFNLQGGNLSSTAQIAGNTAQIAGTSGEASVPEPASLTVLAVGALRLLARRHRRDD